MERSYRSRTAIKAALLLLSFLQILIGCPLRVDAFVSPSLRSNHHVAAVAFPAHTKLPNVRRDISKYSSALALIPTDLEVIPPSFNLAIGTMAVSAAFGLPQSPLKSKLGAFLVGIPLIFFAGFITFQTGTLRFTFSDTDFSLVKSNLSSTGKNLVVGGENSWKYSSFVNYDFFPSQSFPILVYFKETQTPEEMWSIGPGEKANSPEALAKGAKRGQVHFFPAIGNVEEMKSGFEKHNCAKIS